MATRDELNKMSASDRAKYKYNSKIKELNVEIEKLKIKLDANYSKLPANVQKYADEVCQRKRDFNLSSNENIAFSNYIENMGDLDDLEKTLNSYEDLLSHEDNLYSVQVLTDFINEWKNDNINYYIEVCKNYIDDVKKIKSKNYSNEWSRIRKLQKEYTYVFGNFFLDNFIKIDLNINTSEINKIVDDDAHNKYKELLDRISNIVGNITDTSKLTVNNDGQLEGVVDGTKGTAQLETTLDADNFRKKLEDTTLKLDIKNGDIAHSKVSIKLIK